MLFFISLIVSIIIIVYVATDCKHYDKSPWGWGIFAFFFGFLALGIYLCQTKRVGWGTVWIVFWSIGELFSLAHGRLVL